MKLFDRGIKCMDNIEISFVNSIFRETANIRYAMIDLFAPYFLLQQFFYILQLPVNTYSIVLMYAAIYIYI